MIALDGGSKLGSARSHCALAKFLTVVSLRFFLELGDDLVLLAQLEVQLAYLVLEDRTQVTISTFLLSLCRCCRLSLTLSLIFLFLLRDQEVFLFNFLQLSHE